VPRHSVSLFLPFRGIWRVIHACLPRNPACVSPSWEKGVANAEDLGDDGAGLCSGVKLTLALAALRGEVLHEVLAGVSGGRWTRRPIATSRLCSSVPRCPPGYPCPATPDLPGCLFRSSPLTGSRSSNLPVQISAHFRAFPAFMRVSAPSRLETETARKPLSASRLKWLRG
jgi:hypothetical protein